MKKIIDQKVFNISPLGEFTDTTGDDSFVVSMTIVTVGELVVMDLEFTGMLSVSSYEAALKLIVKNIDDRKVKCVTVVDISNATFSFEEAHVGLLEIPEAVTAIINSLRTLDLICVVESANISGAIRAIVSITVMATGRKLIWCETPLEAETYISQLEASKMNEAV